MRLCRSCLTICFVCAAMCRGVSDDATPPRSKSPAAESPDQAAIRATEATFAKAFNQGDAKAVAEHWTPDGEYIDETGARTQGREAIAAKYAAFFAANPKARISFRIERIRPVAAESAIEDGSATVIVPGHAGESASQYSAVHVKRDGKWLMASVRDSAGRSPVRHTGVKDLAWLIGTWTTENKGVDYRVTCRWIVNEQFIEQSFESRQGDKVISSGKQIVGFDPSRQSLGLWTFTSDGGHATGRLSLETGRMVAETEGILADGTETTAVNITSKLDDNAVVWRSVNRSADGVAVPDTEEVILRREHPARSAK